MNFDGQAVLLLSCILAFFLNYSIFLNTTLNSAVTQTICGNLKVRLLIYIGSRADLDCLSMLVDSFLLLVGSFHDCIWLDGIWWPPFRSRECIHIHIYI